MVTNSGEEKLFPRFRESAYTPVKQAVGEEVDEIEKQRMAEAIEICANHSLKKRSKIVEWITNNL
jgi:hydrogenase maturation factor HypE